MISDFFLDRINRRLKVILHLLDKEEVDRETIRQLVRANIENIDVIKKER